MEPSEIKAACVDAVLEDAAVHATDIGITEAERIVNAVLETIIEHTGSLRTVDELMRVKGDA